MQTLRTQPALPYFNRHERSNVIRVSQLVLIHVSGFSCTQQTWMSYVSTPAHIKVSFSPSTSISILLSTVPNNSQLAMESIKTSLRRIMAHMETQTVTPIDVQDPIISRDAHDWSLMSTFEFRSWDMSAGIYTFNTLLTVDRQDSGDYFVFLVSFQVQTVIYHLYRLRQVQIDADSGQHHNVQRFPMSY
jgi:hypothetical protein